MKSTIILPKGKFRSKIKILRDRRCLAASSRRGAPSPRLEDAANA
ncbi:hypothetical protein [Roseomonas sp. WA12]